jgi:2-dehydro-3-deoxyphosphooctonate aldolase (KDO 8-P synthase)
MTASVMISDGVTIGDGRLALLAGPCALETPELAFEVATELRSLSERHAIPLVFKASFDKANRTSGDSFRSIGFERSLEALAAIGEQLGIPVMTDVHETWQVELVARVADVIQIPAFLCRQTDLLESAARTGRVVNVKKGQFMAPGDMAYAVEKLRRAGCERVLLTERGSMFGYHDLVVDFRSLAVMRDLAPVVFDATHSVQTPGGAGGRSGGAREYVPGLARAAVAFGVDALFLETHPRPAEALSDRDVQLPLSTLDELLTSCLAVHEALSGRIAANA